MHPVCYEVTSFKVQIIPIEIDPLCILLCFSYMCFSCMCFGHLCFGRLHFGRYVSSFLKSPRAPWSYFSWWMIEWEGNMVEMVFSCALLAWAQWALAWRSNSHLIFTKRLRALGANKDEWGALGRPTTGRTAFIRWALCAKSTTHALHGRVYLKSLKDYKKAKVHTDLFHKLLISDAVSEGVLKPRLWHQSFFFHLRVFRSLPPAPIRNNSSAHDSWQTKMSKRYLVCSFVVFVLTEFFGKKSTTEMTLMNTQSGLKNLTSCRERWKSGDKTFMPQSKVWKHRRSITRKQHTNLSDFPRISATLLCTEQVRQQKWCLVPACRSCNQKEVTSLCCSCLFDRTAPLCVWPLCRKLAQLHSL